MKWKLLFTEKDKEYEKKKTMTIMYYLLLAKYFNHVRACNKGLLFYVIFFYMTQQVLSVTFNMKYFSC